MARSVLDFYFVQNGCSGPEPSLREMVYKYYTDNILDEAKAIAYARAYCDFIESVRDDSEHP